MEVKDKIRSLDEIIAGGGGNYEIHIERGKEHYRSNNFGGALNDFKSALEYNPESEEAKEFISMIYEILEFRHVDLLNP